MLQINLSFRIEIIPHKPGFPKNEVFPENQAPTKHQRSRIIRAIELSHAQAQRIRMKPGIFYNTSHSKARGRLGYTPRHMVSWGSITVHTHWQQQTNSEISSSLYQLKMLAQSTLNAHTKPREYPRGITTHLNHTKTPFFKIDLATGDQCRFKRINRRLDRRFPYGSRQNKIYSRFSSTNAQNRLRFSFTCRFSSKITHCRETGQPIPNNTEHLT